MAVRETCWKACAWSISSAILVSSSLRKVETAWKAASEPLRELPSCKGSSRPSTIFFSTQVM